MKNFVVSTKSRTIELSKKFAAAASNPLSEEYAQLQTVRRDYPNYKVVTIARKTGKSEFKGLTYDYMRRYIVKHDDAEQNILAEFETLTATSEEALEIQAEAASYHEVKDWFFGKFPAIKAFHEKQAAILDKAA